MKDKQSPPTTRVNVQVPVELYKRLVYMSGLPAHQSWGGTLEALVIRVLEEGYVGIAIHYERFEDKKPITDQVHRAAFGSDKSKTKTRIAAGSKGKRLIHRR